MQTIVILGVDTPIGGELVNVFTDDAAYDTVALSVHDVEVMDQQALKNHIHSLFPDVIFNTIAYTDIDACETDEDAYARAQEKNSVFPGEIAHIAKQIHATLVQYSTDQVFDGQRPRILPTAGRKMCCGSGCRGCMYKGPEESLPHFAYSEYDVPAPVSRYGHTCLEGERNVQKNGQHYIIRVSRVWGLPVPDTDAPDVVQWLYEKGMAGEPVEICRGTIRGFSYAPDIARSSKVLIEEEKEPGIYHMTNDGAATLYDGACALYDIMGWDKNLITLRSADACTHRAPRPQSAVLKVTKCAPLCHYIDALKAYTEQRVKKS